MYLLWVIVLRLCDRYLIAHVFLLLALRWILRILRDVLLWIELLRQLLLMYDWSNHLRRSIPLWLNILR